MVGVVNRIWHGRNNYLDSKVNMYFIHSTQGERALSGCATAPGDVQTIKTFISVGDVDIVMFTYDPVTKTATAKVMGCHAGIDGDCNWDECPQLKHNEPESTGRDCPLIHVTDDPEY